MTHFESEHEPIRYRILIAEDDENDALLMIRTLKGEVITFDPRIVTDREAFAREINDFQPDLVLCDYTLPNFNGSDAVRIVRAAGSDAPVIVVTGTLGDERAADLIKEGVTDYVLKQNLARLPAAVHRAIEDRERRRRRRLAEAESEAHKQRLAHLFQCTLDGILVLGPKGEIVDANSAAAATLGYASADELTGMSWADMIDEDEEPAAALLAPEAEDAQFRRILSAVRGDGRRVELDVALSVQHEHDGHVFGYVILRDVTEQLESQRTLRSESELRRILMRIAHEVGMERDPASDFTRALELIRSFVGWPLAHLYTYDGESGVLVSSGTHAAADNSALGEFVSASKRYTFRPGAGLVGSAFDSVDAVWIDELQAETDFLRREEAGAAGLRSGVAFPVITADGPTAVIELFSDEPRQPDERLIEMMRLIGHELGRLAERKRFHDAMRERRRQLESLVENAPDIIVRFDRNERVTLANSKISLLGLSTHETEGRSLRELSTGTTQSESLAETLSQTVRRVLDHGREETLELAPVIEGDTVHLHAVFVPEHDEDGRIGSVLSVTRDITREREAQASLKEAERQLEQAQRFESIGRLAGGVAHDFNNLLTAINGYLYLARASVDHGSKPGEYIENIAATTERAARLTHQLLLFSRHAPTEMTAIDVNTIIEDMLKFLSRLIGEDITLETDLTDDATVIEGDTGKIEQIVVNLVVNARDAMPDGGTISVETARIPAEIVDAGQTNEPATPDDSRSEPHDHVRTTVQDASETHDHIRMTVRDTGVGMNEETKANIFEPFFTTKGREKGTGLGLPVVYGVVREHGGTIEVETEPGVGTAFHVMIPAASAAAAEHAHAPAAVEEPPRPHGGRVLTVEDDEAIRRMVEQALSRSGFEVSAVGTIREAGEAIDAGARFDVVLSDLVLPDGPGTELPDRLGIDIPYVFASGYLEDTAVLRTVRSRGYPFVQKPYNISVLISTLNETLGRA